jgi:hypothetical protein
MMGELIQNKMSLVGHLNGNVWYKTTILPANTISHKIEANNS